jgi:hypothetical protein
MAPAAPERTRRGQDSPEEGAAKVSVLRADLYLWFLLLSAAVLFALISLVAVGEMLLWRGS